MLYPMVQGLYPSCTLMVRGPVSGVLVCFVSSETPLPVTLLTSSLMDFGASFHLQRPNSFHSGGSPRSSMYLSR